jgi:hypothetical protein
MFGAPARELGYQRWGIKEVFLDPAHVVYLRWLFPASRMLFLVRNPQDAFLSYKTRGPWYLEWPERSIATGWSYGRLWSRLVTGYHALSQEGLGLLVRYEDLETSSERIAAHLGHHVPRPSELPRSWHPSCRSVRIIGDFGTDPFGSPASRLIPPVSWLTCPALLARIIF